MKVLSVIASVVLVAAALGLGRQPAAAQDLDEAARLNEQAKELVQQGRSADAEALFKRSLDIREKTLGPDHVNVAHSLYELGYFYHRQGSYADAEPLYKRSLKIAEKQLGPKHPVVAELLNNMADLYVREEQYTKGEPLAKRSVEILEETLSPEDPTLALSLSTLAEVYHGQQRAEDAEPLYRRSLKIFEKAFRPEHVHIVQLCSSGGGDIAMPAMCRAIMLAVGFLIAAVSSPSGALSIDLNFLSKYRRLGPTPELRSEHEELILRRNEIGTPELRKRSNLELVPTPRSGVELADIEGEGVLYSYEMETMVYLSDSAITIWRLCDGKRTVKEIADLLEFSYPEAAQQIYGDISDTIDHLSQQGVLELGGA